MPKLRATSTVSVGYDNFDVDALNARKIFADAYADRADRNRRRYGDGAGAEHRASGG